MALSLSACGNRCPWRGRKSFRVNYRTTDEIRNWAVAQLANCTIDDLDGQPDTLVGYQSLSHGPAPELASNSSRAEERLAIEAVLERLKADAS